MVSINRLNTEIGRESQSCARSAPAGLTVLPLNCEQAYDRGRSAGTQRKFELSAGRPPLAGFGLTTEEEHK